MDTVIDRMRAILMVLTMENIDELNIDEIGNISDTDRVGRVLSILFLA